MNLSEWKTEAHANLRRLATNLRRMLYGALSASALLPVVMAANQGDFAAVAALGQPGGRPGQRPHRQSTPGMERPQRSRPGDRSADAGGRRPDLAQ